MIMWMEKGPHPNHPSLVDLKIQEIRDIEVKNNLTIAREEWGGDSGKRGLQELL